MSDDLRPSVRATYDSRKTGPRYHTTTTVEGRVVGEFRKPIDDPFVRQTINICWRDLLRGLLRRHLVVEVTIGGDLDVMNDVLELDDQTLIPGRTRNAAFRQSLRQKLRVLAEDESTRPPLDLCRSEQLTEEGT